MFGRTVCMILVIGTVALGPATPPLFSQEAAKDAEIAKLRAEIERLKTDVSALEKRDRETQTEVLRLRKELAGQQNENASLRATVQTLQQRNQELLAQLQKFAMDGKAVKPRGDQKNPNPPPDLVKGKVLKTENGLVRISLGTDHGLAKGHTLEVFRLSPQPKYLGMVRIVDVAASTSVGQMVVPPGGTAPAVHEGDQVSSRLAPTEDHKDQR
jgi:hypothetical protein